MLGIATAVTLLSLGFVMVSYSIKPPHIPLLLHYLWMVLYYLFAMAVMICAEIAFQIATDGWRSPSKAVRYAKGIGSWTTTALVLWLAFWHEHVFLWVVFALTLFVIFWLRFKVTGYGRLMNSPPTQ